MASPTSEQRDDLDAGCADSACSGSACARCRTVECESEDVCWICLDGSTSKDPLIQPCACPRLCHPKCIARWQLQSSGSRREKYCQFCEGELPCWRKTLTPDFAGLPASAPAVMNVNFEGRTFSFEVKSGADGYERFTASIKRSFRLPTESDLNITFTCDCPLTGIDAIARAAAAGEVVSAYALEVSEECRNKRMIHFEGQLLTLQGPGAYDAAVHCAAVSAAKRLSASTPAPSDPAGQPVIAWEPSVDADSDRDDVAAVNRESDARPAQLGSKRRLVFAVKKLRGVVASLLGAS